MEQDRLKYILEALLVSATAPLTLEALASAFESWELPSALQLQEALDELSCDYAPRAIELKLLASGYRLQTKPSYSPWISRLLLEKPTKYSRAFLETLAIIAYKQPVTRADIEDIRGVTVSSHFLKNLLELEWIKVAGHRDVPGKPVLYTTTKTFLDDFNLKSLCDLPEILNEQ